MATELESIATSESEDVVAEGFRKYKAFKIHDIPPEAEIYDVKKALAKSYHSVVLENERWRKRATEKGEAGCSLPQFQVDIHEDDRGTGRLRPSGLMLVPDWGGAFKRHVEEYPIHVPFYPDWNNKDVTSWKKIRLVEYYGYKPAAGLVPSLLRSPWQDPMLEKQHKQRLDSLREVCEVREIQFGFDHFREQTKNARKSTQPPIVHRFFVEWTRKFEDTDSRAHLEFEDGISSMCIVIGPESTRIRQFCKVRYESIRHIEIKGLTIIFNLWTAPILEEGPIDGDETHPRLRLAGLDEQHKRVISRFATKFRVVFYGQDILDNFVKMSKVVGLTIRLAHKDLDKDDGLGIGALAANNKTKRRVGDYLDELSDSKINELNKTWLVNIPYSVAFQIAAMLQNGLVNPIELRELRPKIDNLVKPGSAHASEDGGRMLFQFSQSIPTWTFSDRLGFTLSSKFTEFSDRFWMQGGNLVGTPRAGWFQSYRATLTPTTVRLSGPFQEQSNGVIRHYEYATDHFLRFNFTDEERLQMRWDRNVQGDVFVKEHIGGFLKGGLNIAGHHFDFLGYSNSGLREHSVWFVTPFRKMTNGKITSEWITPQMIRNNIADFSLEAESSISASPQSNGSRSLELPQFIGDASVIKDIRESEQKLRMLPSKLGARLAQAFTTTEPSITLNLNEIEFIGDIKTKPSESSESSTQATEFTDGYGYISLQLADEIWQALHADALRAGATELPSPAPSCYQIRLGGAKGVVGINPLINGRRLVLHQSMVKFMSTDCGLHIATKFDHPLGLYLNRPLIAILEHLGVPIDWFLRLQHKAVSDATETLLSVSEDAAKWLARRHLGKRYGFHHIIRGLAKHGVSRAELEDAPHPILEFFLRSLSVAAVHVDREIKYRARIPVADGLSLVGVADVHLELDEGCVYICTQETDEELKYLPEKPAHKDRDGRSFGYMFITRSPSIHPGDVQRFKAMHPPKGSPYFRHPMLNCVVFSCKGKRPPASMLGGGDLDGDLFQILPETDDFKPDVTVNAADYAAIEPRKLERPAEIDDIADFVVDYINSDKMGLVSIQHLIISDQSRRGLDDKRCLKLAELHSKAVDFAKSGVPVEFGDLPKRLHPYTPDFQHKETVLDDQTNYYESPKALGVLYRAIKVRSMEELSEGRKPSRRRVAYNQHPFYKKLVELCIQKKVAKGLLKPEVMPEFRKAFVSYSTELRGIRSIYSVGRHPLLEEEVFMGTIMQPTSQRKNRDDMAVRLRDVSGQLVDRVRVFLQGDRDDSVKRGEGLHLWLVRSMYALQQALSPEWTKNAHGEVVPDWEQAQCSFGMIALRSAFECMDVLDGRMPDPRRSKPTPQAQEVPVSWGKRQ